MTDFETIINFQEYTAVHTVVPVFTSSFGGCGQMTVLHNGYNDWVLTVGGGENMSVTNHVGFAEVLQEVYWFLVSQLGLNAVDDLIA